jgi:hypothetical protein
MDFSELFFSVVFTISVLFMNPAAAKFKQDKFYCGVASSRIIHCNPQGQSPVQNLLLYVWFATFLPNIKVYTGFVQLILSKNTITELYIFKRSVTTQNFWVHV